VFARKVKVSENYRRVENALRQTPRGLNALST
jgi:hypothetical protein